MVYDGAQAYPEYLVWFRTDSEDEQRALEQAHAAAQEEEDAEQTRAGFLIVSAAMLALHRRRRNHTAMTVAIAALACAVAMDDGEC